jgi:predicted ATP-grasp superfamily ATP-dependent carboligase
LLADYLEALEPHYLFPKPPPGLTRALLNKQGMHALCKQYSIPTPESLFPRSREELVASIATLSFPAVVKLIDNSLSPPGAWAKKSIVHDAETLLQFYDQVAIAGIPNVMVQEFIPGGDEQMWLLNGYFDEQSRCLFGLTAQKLRLFPPYTGLTSLAVCTPNPTLEGRTIELMKAVGYRGLLDIEYKYDLRDGQYKLLDVNPRIGAPFRLFVDTIEMDVARALYCHLTGQPVSVGTMREGRKWVLEPFDLVSSFIYWRDGNLTLRQWVASLHGIREESWFARDDMRPFLAIWWHVLREGLGRRLRESLTLGAGSHRHVPRPDS